MSNISFMNGCPIYEIEGSEELLGAGLIDSAFPKEKQRTMALRALISIRNDYKSVLGLKNYVKIHAIYSKAVKNFTQLKGMKYFNYFMRDATFSRQFAGLKKHRQAAARWMAKRKTVAQTAKRAEAAQAQLSQEIEATGAISGAYGLSWNVAKVDKAIAAGKAQTTEVQGAIQGTVDEATAKKIHRSIHGMLGGVLLPIALVGAGVAAVVMMT